MKDRFGDFEIDFLQGAVAHVTSDNGKEFAEHAKMACELDVGYYFAKPYHWRERGANENMNGQIR